MIKNKATQSAKFMTWLAVQNSLSTKGLISRWMGDCGIDCALCDQGPKIVQHLLFNCYNAI